MTFLDFISGGHWFWICLCKWDEITWDANVKGKRQCFVERRGCHAECLLSLEGWIRLKRLISVSFPWCHNERDGTSNHQPLHCLLNCWFRHRCKKTSKLRVTGFSAGNSPVTGEFPAQKASNAENVSIMSYAPIGDITVASHHIMCYWPVVCSTACYPVKASYCWPSVRGFPSQRASNAENVSMPWRHRDRGVCDNLIIQIDVWSVVDITVFLSAVDQPRLLYCSSDTMKDMIILYKYI